MPRPDGPLLVLHQNPEQLRPLLEGRFPDLDWRFAGDEAAWFR